VDALDVVNLRVGGFNAPESGSLGEAFTTFAELQQRGLIKHLGVSTVDTEQIAEAQSIAPVVAMQNFYNVANRQDDSLIDSLAVQGVSSVPYFPLAGLSPLQSTELSSVATRLETTPMTIAVAWLLQRSPNILLIPGTFTVTHLLENIAGAGLVLDSDALAELEVIVD
jgi:pyridoxine 4-dehydrogenase